MYPAPIINDYEQWLQFHTSLMNSVKEDKGNG